MVPLILLASILLGSGESMFSAIRAASWVLVLFFSFQGVSVIPKPHPQFSVNFNHIVQLLKPVFLLCLPKFFSKLTCRTTEIKCDLIVSVSFRGENLEEIIQQKCEGIIRVREKIEFNDEK